MGQGEPDLTDIMGELEMLRAALLDGWVGGVEDGANRYPAEPYIHAPEKADLTAGRCLVDGRPVDDHELATRCLFG